MKLFTFIPVDTGEGDAVQISAKELSHAIELLFDPCNFHKSEWAIYSVDMEEVL